MRYVTTGWMLGAAAFALGAAGMFALSHAQPRDEPTPLVSIKELMEKTIVPATDTIWAAWEPPADEAAWVELEQAAVTLLAASTVNALGGTGPMDDEWASQPAWQAFNDAMIRSGRDALEAIRARDHDALLEAQGALVEPCSACHMQFNPAVVGAQP